MSTRAVRLATLGAWLLAMGIVAFIAARARYTADLSAFLPGAPTAAQQLLVEQLREGPASRILLVAVEGTDAPRRAALAASLAARLRADAAFGLVANGEEHPADGRLLLEQRYLLSDAVQPARFTASGLRAALTQTLATLASSAGLALADLVPRDPTGELLHHALSLQGGFEPQVQDGTWVSRDGRRAMLLVHTRASGSDTDAQAQAIAAIRSAFTAIAADPALAHDAAQPAASLLVTGPGAFAVEARAAIVREAVRLSILGSVLTMTLLALVYRSLAALLLSLLPVATGALAGTAAVAAGFGVVHGLTLGFGVTLIGEAVDYAIYLFVQSNGAEAPSQTQLAGRGGWFRTHWPTIRLGTLTSACGFAALTLSGFPGLAQLGLYSVAGLAAASLATRYVLPLLIPAGMRPRDLSRSGELVAHLASRLQGVRALPPLLVVAGVGALALLLAQRGGVWDRELTALSPVPPAAQDLDGDLRAALGAPEVRDVVVVSGPDLETTLQRTERAAQALQPLMTSGAIGGFEDPSRLLPSTATQKRRQAALPAPPELRAALVAATAGLPLRPERLEPFLDDVEAARIGPLLTRDSLQGTSFAAAFDSLTLRTRDSWRALLPLRAAAGVSQIDRGAVAAALGATGLEATQLLDLKAEADALYRNYLAEALRLVWIGLAAICLLLLLALRSVARVARVLLPLVLAALLVAAALVACGRQLGLMHLVGLLLIVAVGSNYALFFDAARNRGAAASAATYASIALACATSVIGFGVLAFSGLPVIRALGETVAPGGALALLLAAIFCGPARPAGNAAPAATPP